MNVRRIILVDDEKDMRDIAELSLRKKGNFDVVSMASGAEALKLARREPPDLIISDIMMPGMNGAEFIRRLRENAETANIPVIFLSASAKANEKEKYIAAGACGIIEKPFDPRKLSEQVRAITDRL